MCLHRTLNNNVNYVHVGKCEQSVVFLLTASHSLGSIPPVGRKTGPYTVTLPSHRNYKLVSHNPSLLSHSKPAL